MSSHHEVIEQFRAAGLPLNAKLEAMLDEAPAHRTERRGCGFTQATRYLAERINHTRNECGLDDLKLFRDWPRQARKALGSSGADEWDPMGWRDLDRRGQRAHRRARANSPSGGKLAVEAARQAALREIPETMTREESALIARMVRDIVLPIEAGAKGLFEAPSWPEKLPVGSCPTAEKCFLELAHGFIPRKGRCNLLVDGEDRAILIEKIRMGDDHSCISVAPFAINGVRIPVGSLVAVHYDPQGLTALPSQGTMPGARIPLADCLGVRMLRLTTLAVSPGNRARAFSAHFEAQQAAGLFEPEATELAWLMDRVDRVSA